MKIHSAALPDKARPVLLLAADVSKSTLHLFSRFPSGHHQVTVEDVVPNRTAPVEEALTRVQALAHEHGLAGVRVLCESSGGYERLYLAVARRLGIETALVSPEQVGRLTKLESLDTGKTDKKDARVGPVPAQSTSRLRWARRSATATCPSRTSSCGTSPPSTTTRS